MAIRDVEDIADLVSIEPEASGEEAFVLWALVEQPLEIMVFGMTSFVEATPEAEADT